MVLRCKKRRDKIMPVWQLARWANRDGRYTLLREATMLNIGSNDFSSSLGRCIEPFDSPK